MTQLLMKMTMPKRKHYGWTTRFNKIVMIVEIIIKIIVIEKNFLHTSNCQYLSNGGWGFDFIRNSPSLFLCLFYFLHQLWFSFVSVVHSLLQRVFENDSVAKMEFQLCSIATYRKILLKCKWNKNQVHLLHGHFNK